MFVQKYAVYCKSAIQNLELGDVFQSGKIATVLTQKKGKKLEKSQTTLERKIEIDYVSYLDNLGK